MHRLLDEIVARPKFWSIMGILLSSLLLFAGVSAFTSKNELTGIVLVLPGALLTAVSFLGIILSPWSRAQLGAGLILAGIASILLGLQAQVELKALDGPVCFSLSLLLVGSGLFFLLTYRRVS